MDRHNDSTLESRQAAMWTRNNIDVQQKPRPTKGQAVCHPDKSEYRAGTGLCRSCYDSVRHTGERGRAKALAHVEANTSLTAAMRADVAEQIGKIQAYVRKPEPERKHVDTRKPSVRKHVATAVVVSGMDFEKAAETLKPEATPYEQHVLASKLATDPNVRTEVQSLLKKRGLDDESREHFVNRLWELFESTDPRLEQKALAAMRILGRAFVSEKAENVQVETLKIAGINEGLARMMGGGDEAQAGVSPFDEVRAQLNVKDEAEAEAEIFE